MNTYNIWLPLKYTAIRAGSWGWTKVLSWHQPLPCSWLCQPIRCAFSPVVYLLLARQVVLQVSNVSISLASLLRKVRFLMTASSWQCQRTNRLYSSFFWTAKTLGKNCDYTKTFNWGLHKMISSLWSKSTFFRVLLRLLYSLFLHTPHVSELGENKPAFMGQIILLWSSLK